MMEREEPRKPFKELENELGSLPDKRHASPGSKSSPLRKSPLRKKARVNSPTSSQESPAGSVTSNGSGPALDFFDDSASSTGSQTPPLSQVELNTRLNSLRPFNQQSHPRNRRSDTKRENRESMDEESGGATITLEAFQNLLNEAEGEDEDEEDLTKSRRNTASPSFLKSMLEMSDDEEEEEKLITQAAQRGREIAQKLSDQTNQAFLSPPPSLQIQTQSPRVEESESEHLNTPPQPTHHRAAEKDKDKVWTGRTPLKSCISARKNRETDKSQRKKKSVVFGSPNAAEFDHKDPVKGGVTPLAKNYARSRYKMEDRQDDEEEEEELESSQQQDEDINTALNSSILATWEEEESDDEQDEDERGGGKRRKKSISSSSERRRRKSSEKSSRRNGRRSSSIYGGSGAQLMPKESLDLEDDEDQQGQEREEDSSKSIKEQSADLSRKFDAVAMEDEEDIDIQLAANKGKQKDQGKRNSSNQPVPPSPHTAELQLQKVLPSSEAEANKNASFQSPSIFSSGDTVDLSELRRLAESPITPESSSARSHQSTPRSPPVVYSSTGNQEESSGDQTIDLATFSQMMETSPEQATSNRKQGGQQEDQDEESNRTIDLHDLSQLGKSTPGSMRADDTIDLDLFTQLASSGKSNKVLSQESKRSARKKQAQEMMALRRSPRLLKKKKKTEEDEREDDVDEEQQTVELGSLSELAQFSGRGKSKASRGERKASLDVPQEEREHDVEEGDEHTVELGTLSDLAALSPKPTNQQEQRGVEHDENEPTVPLGSLSELASLQSPGDVAAAPAASQQSVQDDEDRTVELGKLSDLAAMSDDEDSEEESPPRVDRRSTSSRVSSSRSTKHEERKSGETALRLSFSSLASSNDDETKSKEKTAFNSAALLNQFVNSPSASDDDNDGEGQQDADERQEEEEEDIVGHATKRDSDVHSYSSPVASADGFHPTNDLSRTPLENKPTLSPLTSEPSPAMSTGQPEESNEVEQKSNVASPEPTDMVMDDEREEEEREEEEEEEMEQPKPTISPWEFLARFGVEPCNVQDTDDAESDIARVEEENNLPPVNSITTADLEQASRSIAEIYGCKWGINELLGRSKACQQTVKSIIAGLEKENPDLFHAPAEQVEQVFSRMLEHSHVEARVSNLDVQVKALKLSLQAANEHAEILCEDSSILDEGIERLDEAIELAEKALQEKKRKASLRESLTEQKSVLAMYTENIQTLEESKATHEKELEEAQATVRELQTALDDMNKKRVKQSALSELEIELQGKSAILDVAHGFHIWRLQQVSSALVVLAVDHPSGNSDLVSISFDETPQVTSIVAQHCLPNGEVSSIGAQSNGTSSGDIAWDMECIFSKRLARKVVELNTSMSQRAPSCLPELLRQIDLDLGRLQDLFEEITDIVSCCGSPCSIDQQDEKILFSVDLLHEDVGALVKVSFSISDGYPLVKGSCQVSFQVVSEGNKESLLELLNQNVAKGSCVSLQSFTPLSDLWSAIESIVRP